MNVVCMMGILPRDPETKTYGEEGKTITTFTIGVKKGFRDMDWFECVAFGKTGETISKFFHKGDSIAIEGNLHVNKYKAKDGHPVTQYNININGFSFTGKKSKGEDEDAPAPVEKDIPAEDVDDGDLPF